MGHHVMDCRSPWTVESVCATVVVIMASLVRTLVMVSKIENKKRKEVWSDHKNLSNHNISDYQKLEYASTTVVNVRTRPQGLTRAGGESSVRRGAVLGI